MRRRHDRLRAGVAFAIVGALTSCTQNLAERAVCEGGDGQVAIAWQPQPGIDSYRVFRANDGMNADPIGEVTGASFVDTNLQNGTRYGYIIRAVVAEGVAVRDLAVCEAVAEAGDPTDVAAVADLLCRPKRGKVDLSWSAVPDAAIYRILRSVQGAPAEPIAEVTGTAYADLALSNGVSYAYSLIALTADGSRSEQSTACVAVPIAVGEGTPPDPVTDLSCRGKRDKVDLSWNPVAGAAYYRVRRTANGVDVELGQVLDPVFADFGLESGTAHAYQVLAVSGSAVSSEPSVACNYTPRERGDGNLAPLIVSDPITGAREEQLYSYQVTTRDPDGDAVTLGLTTAPTGMEITTSGYISWRPATSQIGPRPVEIRATDARGAHTSQAFIVDVEAFDRPPRITSIPVRSVRIGERYAYDVEATDREGDALSYGFDSPAPNGMTIDAATGAITWAPAQGASAENAMTVRVADPAGGFDTQTWRLDVAGDPLLLQAPSGAFEIRAGETLELEAQSNYPRAGFLAKPLPKNATFDGKRFRFTPVPGQAGVHNVAFYALFAGMRAVNPVVITVVRDNAPPLIAPIADATVQEGAELRIPVAASDPDDDPVVIIAPGLALENAFFDELNHEFAFRPSHEQAGTYQVVFEASDGRATAQESVEITVEDAVAPVVDLALTVDPPQSPTFVKQQSVSGSVVGEVVSTLPTPAPLVTGLAPANAAQGRTQDVVLTGLRTAFAANVTQVTFGAGIAVENVEVLSPTSLRARVAVAADAELGVRAVRVLEGGQEIPSVVAFRVEQGSSEVRGQIVDSFRGAPVAGARVTLDGTSLSVETDETGHFVLVGAPPGDGTLVVVTPNYDVFRTKIAIVSNQAVELGNTVEIDALARPATPAGSLPRAATVASVLDRGLGSKDGDLDQQQTEALVVDTFLALQSKDVGVLDEAGEQLNPLTAGSGIMSLKPAAVEELARRWRGGHMTDLGELVDTIDGGFAVLRSGRFNRDGAIEAFQAAVDAAWADPSAADSILPILLFNEGTTLSSKAPLLTTATSLNAVQSYLFLTSYIVANFGSLNLALDRLLERAGLDPDTIENPAFALSGERSSLGEKFASRFEGFWARARDAVGNAAEVVGGALVRTANAAPQGQLQGAEGGKGSNNILGATLWAKIGSIWDIAVNSFTPAVFAGAFALAAIGIFAAFTGAAFLTVGTAIAVGTAFMSGLLVGFMGKLWAVTTGPDTVVALTPEPPRIESFLVPGLDGTKKVAIVFERSSSDLAAEENSTERFLPYIPVFSEVADLVGPGINPQFLEYEYHLWRYPTLDSTSIKDGQFITDLSLPDPEDPEKRQFLIRGDTIPEGRSFYRVVAVQYYDSFITRSIFSGGEREVYDLKTTYQDFGLKIPDGIPNGGIDSVEVLTALGKDNVNSVVTRSLTDIERIRSDYQAKALGVINKLGKGQGLLRDLDDQVRAVRQKVTDLRAQWPEFRRAQMQRHIDVIVELDKHIRTSIENRTGSAAAVAALRDPGNPLSTRLQTLLGPDLYADTISALERSVRLELQLRENAGLERRQQGILSDLETQRDLVTRERALAEALPPGSGRAFEVDLSTEPLPSEGPPPPSRRYSVVSSRTNAGDLTISIVPSDPQAPTAQSFDDLAGIVSADVETQKSRVSSVSAENTALAKRLDTDAHAVQQAIVEIPAIDAHSQQLGLLDAEEATIRADIHDADVELKKIQDDAVRVDAERVEATRRADLPEKVLALDDLHRSKGGLRRFASSAMDAIGVVGDVLEAPIEVREGIKVIPSAPSAAYVVEKVNGEIKILTPGESADLAPLALRAATSAAPATDAGRSAARAPSVGSFAPNFETDWNADYHLAFLHTASDPDNTRAGFLVREHFFGIPDATNIDAGFPSALIAQDSRGRVYLNNANSNEELGGRIFRFSGAPIAREHVGVVNYWSLTLGIARPATPVAMAISDYDEPGTGLVEDLFIANIDSDQFYGAGLTATNRILRLPVHLTETNPAFANGQLRHRIVAQPYAEHPDFKFTGPSDIVADRRNAISVGIARLLYLSDEEILFAIEPGETGTVKKLIDIPGRRWSGLAVDTSGNLLFADWNAGEVYVITPLELDGIRDGSGSPITTNEELDRRAYLIKEGLDGPTDIELDSIESRYVVSTNEGFQPFNFSVVGRLAPGSDEVRLLISDHELKVTYRPTRGGVFIAGFTSEGSLGKEARLKVRRIEPITGRAYWDISIVRLALFGASVLPGTL